MIRPREIDATCTMFAARTPTLPPATHTNSYALGSREVLLVEPATPFEDEQREWLAWVRGMRSAGRRVVALLATHHHPDHVGGLDVLARELRVPFWVHEETAKRLDHSVPVARFLVDGETIALDGPVPSTWTVLHTPGHAAGHLCFLDKERGTLVVGDMVASEGTILIAPDEGNMTVYLRELRRLEALSARVALPAHGGPIDEPSKCFARYVEHRLAREEKVLRALASRGKGSLFELLPLAYDDAPMHLYPVAALSLESHLLKLEQDRMVMRDDRGAWSLRAEAREPGEST